MVKNVNFPLVMRQPSGLFRIDTIEDGAERTYNVDGAFVEDWVRRIRIGQGLKVLAEIKNNHNKIMEE